MAPLLCKYCAATSFSWRVLTPSRNSPRSITRVSATIWPAWRMISSSRADFKRTLGISGNTLLQVLEHVVHFLLAIKAAYNILSFVIFNHGPGLGPIRLDTLANGLHRIVLAHVEVVTTAVAD